MTRNSLMMAAVAVVLAAPMAAHAQQAAPRQPMPSSQDAPMPPPAMPVNPASQAAMPASASVGAPDANVQAMPTTDASGAQIVSNGPVPDTRANRAKYGRPMSNAGRMTKPAGN